MIDMEQRARLTLDWSLPNGEPVTLPVALGLDQVASNNTPHLGVRAMRSSRWLHASRRMRSLWFLPRRSTRCCRRFSTLALACGARDRCARSVRGARSRWGRVLARARSRREQKRPRAGVLSIRSRRCGEMLPQAKFPSRSVYAEAWLAPNWRYCNSQLALSTTSCVGYQLPCPAF